MSRSPSSKERYIPEWLTAHLWQEQSFSSITIAVRRQNKRAQNDKQKCRKYMYGEIEGGRKATEKRKQKEGREREERVRKKCKERNAV